MSGKGKGKGKGKGSGSEDTTEAPSSAPSYMYDDRRRHLGMMSSSSGKGGKGGKGKGSGSDSPTSAPTFMYDDRLRGRRHLLEYTETSVPTESASSHSVTKWIKSSKKGMMKISQSNSSKSKYHATEGPSDYDTEYDMTYAPTDEIESSSSSKSKKSKTAKVIGKSYKKSRGGGAGDPEESDNKGSKKNRRQLGMMMMMMMGSEKETTAPTTTPTCFDCVPPDSERRELGKSKGVTQWPAPEVTVPRVSNRRVLRSEDKH